MHGDDGTSRSVLEVVTHGIGRDANDLTRIGVEDEVEVVIDVDVISFHHAPDRDVEREEEAKVGRHCNATSPVLFSGDQSSQVVVGVVGFDEPTAPLELVDAVSKMHLFVGLLALGAWSP